jgi:hypothetical protein
MRLRLGLAVPGTGEGLVKVPSYYVTVDGMPVMPIPSTDINDTILARYTACQVLRAAHAHAKVEVWQEAYPGEPDAQVIAVDNV